MSHDTLESAGGDGMRPSTPHPAAAAMRANVLVVDDRPENLLAIDAALEPLGQRLVHARTGEEALRHILREDFAVVLMDVHLPGISGFETVALMKQRERSRHVPVIFITASSTDGDTASAVRGYAEGAVDYLHKPVDVGVLRSKVAVFVELFLRGQRLRLREAELHARERRAIEAENETRFRTLAASMPQSLWTADANGTITYVNRAWIDTTGCALESIAERGISSVLHPDDRAPFDASWSRSLRTGAPIEMEHRIHRAHDGAYRWHLTRAVAVSDADGVPQQWFGTSMDIDDRRRAEDRLRFLSEASRILASTLDYEATLANVARLVLGAMCDTCSVHLLDPGSGGVRALVFRATAPEMPEQRAMPLDQNATHGPAAVLRTGVAELCSDDEKIPHVRSYVSVPLRAGDQVFGALTLMRAGQRSEVYDERDLAFTEALAARVGSAIENARLVRQRDDFLAVAAHELRTPLTSMTLHLQRLLRPTKPLTPEMAVNEATHANRALARLRRMVETLLDVSRMGSRKLELAREEIDLSSLVNDVLQRYEPQMQRAHITVESHVESGVRGRWDPLRIEEVLTNLLNNAMRHGVGAPIEVTLTIVDHRARLCVRDHGPGVAQGDRERIFERFERSSLGHHGGFGLGLWIARTIVDAHGGSIHVEAAEGGGAAFVVELPMQSG